VEKQAEFEGLSILCYNNLTKYLRFFPES